MTRSIITVGICLAAYNQQRFGTNDPVSINVMSYARTNGGPDQLKYSPELFLPPLFFNGTIDEQEGGTNSGPILSRFIYTRRETMKGKNILEIGCGTGSVTIALAELENAKIFACDFDQRAVEACTATISGRTNIRSKPEIIMLDALMMKFLKKDEYLLLKKNGEDFALDYIFLDLPLLPTPSPRSISMFERPYLEIKDENTPLTRTMAELLRKMGSNLHHTQTKIISSVYIYMKRSWHVKFL